MEFMRAETNPMQSTFETTAHHYLVPNSTTIFFFNIIFTWYQLGGLSKRNGNLYASSGSHNWEDKGHSNISTKRNQHFILSIIARENKNFQYVGWALKCVKQKFAVVINQPSSFIMKRPGNIRCFWHTENLYQCSYTVIHYLIGQASILGE